MFIISLNRYFLDQQSLLFEDSGPKRNSQGFAIDGLSIKQLRADLAIGQAGLTINNLDYCSCMMLIHKEVMTGVSDWLKLKRS